MHKGQGVKSKMTLEQEKRLYECITTKYPAEVSFAPHMNWTAPLACQWLETEEGIYSARGMRNVFKRLKLSYTRPTYIHKKANLEKQAAFQEEFVSFKNLIFEDIDHILFEDESMIRDYQAICKTWFAIGQQRIIPTYGKHEDAKLVGVLDYETGAVYVEEHRNYDALVFLSFLKAVMLKYPTGRVVIILDNAKIHHAKLLSEFLSLNKDRLSLVFLPLYSPNLNLIEGLWGWLKDSVINNVFFRNVSEIKCAVRGFVDWINTVPGQVIDRLCLKM